LNGGLADSGSAWSAEPISPQPMRLRDVVEPNAGIDQRETSLVSTHRRDRPMARPLKQAAGAVHKTSSDRTHGAGVEMMDAHDGPFLKTSPPCHPLSIGKILYSIPTIGYDYGYPGTAILRAVYRERNLTTAAKRCFVSQPSISAAITGLEAELGTTLFIRTRRASPTAAAERVPCLCPPHHR